jgi:hypothetical protein
VRHGGLGQGAGDEAHGSSPLRLFRFDHQSLSYELIEIVFIVFHDCFPVARSRKSIGQSYPQETGILQIACAETVAL